MGGDLNYLLIGFFFVKQVDFFVIGTQKGGTKSLYSYFDAHPMVHMPYHFEVGFFTFDERYKKGLSWYLKEYFGKAEKQKKWGEISPQYMSAIYSAKRIKEHFPKTHLISSLRNPIDRAYSAYRMMVRKGTEKRTFEQAVDDLEQDLINRDPIIEFNEILGEFEYLRTGFYGFILNQYLQFFSKDQIKIIFTEHLQSRPEDTLYELFQFVGVDGSKLPHNYKEKRHKGGGPRFPLLNMFFDSKFYRILAEPIKPFLPRKWRNLSHKIQEWNVSPDDNPTLSTELRLKLKRIYQKDIEILESTFNLKVPWYDFH